MLTPLPSPWPVLTAKGRGDVYAVLDYSQDHDTLFLVVLRETGEGWWIPMWEVRWAENWSLERRYDAHKVMQALRGEQ